MKKQLLLLMLVYAGSYCSSITAMTAEETAVAMVTLILDDQHTYQIPAEMASMLGILQIAGYDANNHAYSLQGSNLDPAVLEVFADILRAAYILPKRNPELRAIGAGEKYLNAITQALQLNVRITAESLFSWSDYLNFPLGIYLAGNMLLQRPLPSRTIFPDNTKIHELMLYVSTLVEENGLSPNSYKTFVKFIYLSSIAAKANIEINVEGIGYSIRDYLDFKPDAIKFEHFKETEMRDLDLADLNLNSLDGLNDIPGIDKVKGFRLDGNFLTVIHAQEFSRMPNLMNLYLDGNEIREIHEDAFKDLFELHQLSLGHNNLSFIHPRTFHGNPKLSVIGLASNQLRNFYPSTFQKLYSLRWLHLEQNPIVDIDPRIFNDLHQTIIDLNDNPLSDRSKKLILQWLEENARERIIIFSNGHKEIVIRPFIKFEGHDVPQPQRIPEPLEGQAPH